MKTKTGKRLLSIFMAAAMIISMLPTVAFAETTTTLADGTIQLTSNTTLASLSSNATYDLNGHDLTYTGGQVTVTQGQTLRFIDSSATGSAREGTLKSGTLKMNNFTDVVAAVLHPAAGGKVEASDIYVASTGAAFFPAGDAAAVNITNCDVKAPVYCVGTNSGSSSNFNVVITLKDSVFTGTDSSGDNCPVLINVPGTLIMDNCKVTGDRQAVMVRAGTATITDCEIILTGTYNDSHTYETGTWGSGNEVPMGALVVGSQTSSGANAYAADAICTVEDTDISVTQGSTKPAVYVSSNKEGQSNTYKSDLKISGSGSAINGDIVVADGKTGAESSVIVTDNATVTGGVTNNSAVSKVAVTDNATVTGTLTSASTGTIYNEATGTVTGITGGSTAVAVNKTTATVYTDLATAVSEANAGDTVQLTNNVTINASALSSGQGALNISKSITLDGNGKTITAGNGFSANEKGSRGEYHIINVVDGANVTISDLTIDGKKAMSSDIVTNGARSGINVYTVQGATSQTQVTLENVTVKDCTTYAVTNNHSVVTVNGLTTSGNNWGGINVEGQYGDASLTVNNANISEANSISFEESGSDPVGNASGVIRGGQFQYITTDINDFNSLTIYGGTFAPLDDSAPEGAINIADYVPDGYVYNPTTGTVSVYVEPPYTGSYNYPVTLPTDLENGSVTVAKEDLWATDGEKITVTVTPDEGYMLDELTITDKAGNKVAYTDNGDGTYTFTMPAGSVNIDATFVVDPDYEAPSDEPEEPDTPTLVEDRYTDVAAGAWYRDAVQYVVDNGIMTGTSATTFEPQTATTRAMIVSMLHRLEGNPAARDTTFSDVAAGSWYADPVAWAAANGIVVGYEDDTFQPNRTITREELASILYRYAEYKGLDTTARADLSIYTDSPSPWAYDVMAWANAQGLITGRTATTIDAQATLTRAETAAIFQRFLTE